MAGAAESAAEPADGRVHETAVLPELSPINQPSGMVNIDPPNRHDPAARFEDFWAEVTQISVGTPLTEGEISDYIVGGLNPEEMERLERLLATAPEFAAKLRRARHEFADAFPPDHLAEIEQRIRRGCAGDAKPDEIIEERFLSAPSVSARATPDRLMADR